MPAAGTRKQAREARLDVIVHMLTKERWPRYRIYKALRDEYGISNRTIRRDFQELGKRIRDHLDDPDVIEARVSTVLDNLEKIAVEAFEKKQWFAAIRANVEVGRMLGLRTDRWAALRTNKIELEPEAEVTPIGGARARIAKRATELAELSVDELELRRTELVARFRVIEGGRGTG